MMRRKLVVLTALLALALGQPTQALGDPDRERERDCEDICADLAAENCEDIDSVRCGFLIAGCLLGCSMGKLVEKLRKD
jgi:hypothetical protein